MWAIRPWSAELNNGWGHTCTHFSLGCRLERTCRQSFWSSSRDKLLNSERMHSDRAIEIPDAGLQYVHLKVLPSAQVKSNIEKNKGRKKCVCPYMFACVSVCIGLSPSLSVCIRLSVCGTVFLQVCTSVCLPQSGCVVCLSIRPSVSPSVVICLSVSICRSVRPSCHLSVWTLSTHLSLPLHCFTNDNA